MDLLTQYRPSPDYFAWSLILLYAIFAVAWYMDTKFHDKYLGHPDGEGERNTHRLILIPSILMEISLILMFWWPMESLPFFIACYLTRTIQEFIDELHWHTKRCTLNESLAHIVMWLTIHSKTFITFIWGFYYQYEGITQLPTVHYVLFAIIISCVFIISAYDSRS